jgi:diguanylate cyclase (GGDEF)-like protein
MVVQKLKMLEVDPFFVIPRLATERGQAVARFCWSALFLVYLLVNRYLPGDASEYTYAWTIAGAQLVFSIATMCFVLRDKVDRPYLRQFGAVADQCFFAAMLYLTGEVAVPFIMMPMLLTFGSGLRYGRKYALLSWTFGAALTLTALELSPYWEQHSAVRTGLIMATIFLPVYVLRLTDALALAMRTDSLTGLSNRVRFNELLDETCVAVASATLPSAVVFIDLDGFKRVNDEQGHDRGDAVLKHAAHALRVELAPLGHPARIGGDEFAVVVRKLGSRAELEAALMRFLKNTVDVGLHFDSALGASAGVYFLEPGSAVCPRFACKAADNLMYKAKALGKNQVITSAGQKFSDDGKLLGHGSESTIDERHCVRVA